MTSFVPKCVRCGTAYWRESDGFYAVCDCLGSWAAGPQGLSGPSIEPRPLCDWCGGKQVLHNLDGDNLCRDCCNKWVRSEGLQSQELAKDEQP